MIGTALLFVYGVGFVVTGIMSGLFDGDFALRSALEERTGAEGRVVLRVGAVMLWPALLVVLAVACVALVVTGAARGIAQIVRAVREPIPKAKVRK